MNRYAEPRSAVVPIPGLSGRLPRDSWLRKTKRVVTLVMEHHGPPLAFYMGVGALDTASQAAVSASQSP